MTVQDLKEELSFYDDDAEVIFEVDCDFEPESITEDRWGNRKVHLNSKLNVFFMSSQNGNLSIDLDLGEDKV